MEVDVFDKQSGKWWQGRIKRIGKEEDPLVTIDYVKTLPEIVPISKCKLVKQKKDDLSHFIDCIVMYV
jgi:hypothetical protein